MKYRVCSFLCQLESLEHSLLYKLNLPYLIERVLAFYETQNFVSMFTKVFQWRIS
jgi:hypothetical protein